jgi:hypothetical protein
VIETILMWFPQHRAVRKRLARADRMRKSAEVRAEQAERRYAEMAARFDREAAEHKADLKASADGFARAVTGRYTYARASEGITEIVAEPSKPVPGRKTAQDVVAEKTRQFYKDILNGRDTGNNGTADAA